MFEPLDFQLLGYKARLLHPEYLLLGAVTLVFVLGLGWAQLRRQRLVEATLPARLRGQLLPGYAPARAWTAQGLISLGLLLLPVSLSQLQCGAGTELAAKVGLDVVVALDLSRSMQARDVPPSRLERAQLELGDLISSLEGDRFGLVVFAGTAFVQCPLTSDYAAARLFLRAADPAAMPHQGTDLAGALRTAGELLGAQEGGRSRVIVLLTDGEDHSGEALKEAKLLAREGVQVFAVGIGSPGGEPIPELDERGNFRGYLKDASGQTVLSRLDVPGLKAIAEATGGRLVTGGARSAGVAEVIEALQALERSELEARLTTRYEDRSVLFLFPAFLALLLGTLWRGRAGHPRPGAPLRAELGVLLLALAAPALMGAGPFEVEHPEVRAGNEAAKAGDFDEAQGHYEAALDALEDPKQRSRVRFNMGTAYAQAGDLERASEALQASAQGDPELAAQAYYNLGTGRLKAGDAQGAVEALVRSLQIAPEAPAARENLERALRLLQTPPPSSKPQDQDNEKEEEDDSQSNEDEAPPEDEGEQPEQPRDEAEANKEGEPDDSQEGDSGDQGEEDGGEDERPEGGDEQGGEQGEEEADAQPEAGEGETPPPSGEDEGEAQGEGARPEDREAGQAGAPQEVSEQEAEQLLEAVERGEVPFQMQRFQRDKTPPPQGQGGKPW